MLSLVNVQYFNIFMKYTSPFLTLETDIKQPLKNKTNTQNLLLAKTQDTEFKFRIYNLIRKQGNSVSISLR